MNLPNQWLHFGTLTGLLMVAACANSGALTPPPGTGDVAGNGSQGGSATGNGGAASMGGSSETGGAFGTGGAPIATGGATFATGGSPNATGGAAPATGGAPRGTGGTKALGTGGTAPAIGGAAPATGGSIATETGGTSPATGGDGATTGGDTSTGGADSVVTGGAAATTGGKAATGGADSVVTGGAAATTGGNAGTGGTLTAATGGAPATGGATSTPPPSGNLGVYINTQNGDKIAGGQALQLYLEIVNTSTASQDLSKVTMRYWYVDDGWGSAALVMSADYVSIGYSNSGTVQYNGSTAVTPAHTGADHYFEFSFTGTLLATGDSKSNDKFNVHVQLHTGGFTGTADVTNDYSYTSATGYDSKITLYSAGTLVWGTEPGG